MKQHTPESRRRDDARRKARMNVRRYTLLERQGGVCAICGTDDPGTTKGWHLDHDHACCSVPPRQSCGECDRGALCHHCNLGLGGFKDSPEALLAACRYLGLKD